MKTTLEFDDRLSRAARDGEALTRLIERALRDSFGRHAFPSVRFAWSC